MPHAEDMSTTQTETLTNGDQKSQFLSHLTSYPIVTDGIEGFKNNSIGAKSIEIADATYNRVGKPLEPHLRTPYSYAKPYVNKADSLADQALGRFDKNFPIVKKDTNTIFDTARGYAFWPFQLAGDGKNYLFTTYSEQYKKTAKGNNRGDGPVTIGLAIISTELKIIADVFGYIAETLNQRGSEVKEKTDDLASTANKKKDELASAAHKKKDEASSAAHKKKDQAQDAIKN